MSGDFAMMGHPTAIAPQLRSFPNVVENDKHGAPSSVLETADMSVKTAI